MPTLLPSAIPFRVFLLFPCILAALLSLSSVVQAAGYSTHPSMLNAAQRYQGGDELEAVWDLWNNTANPDNRTKAARTQQRKTFQTTDFSDEVKQHSHHYYILEAKMGLSQQSQKLNDSDLVKSNAGLSAFRDGVIPFFSAKDYKQARWAFTHAIILSAKLAESDHQKLFELTGPIEIKLSDNRESKFSHALTDHFIQAEVAEKNEILNLINTKKLPEKEQLNLHWALGGLIATSNKLEPAFTESQLYAENSNSLYLKLKNKFNFATTSNSIWFPWY